MINKYSRGDTVIEVMVSFVVLSLLVVGAYTVMNIGTQTAQRSLEVTLVRQNVDMQISLIRYIKENNPTQWGKITSSDFISNTAVDISDSSKDGCPRVGGGGSSSLPSNAFFIRTHPTSGVEAVKLNKSNYEHPEVYALVSSESSKGVFAQIVKAEGADANIGATAYDVYVSACWDTVGLKVPMTVSTVTRLYDKK